VYHGDWHVQTYPSLAITIPELLWTVCANVAVSLPYRVGNFELTALRRQKSAYRSGLFNLGVPFSVNLRTADFYMRPQAPQTQASIGSFEGHLSRDFGCGAWVSAGRQFLLGWRDDFRRHRQFIRCQPSENRSTKLPR
jgi:hypothetical protein